MFLCEVSTEWYERYQRLLEVSDEFGGLTMDEPDQDEENYSIFIYFRTRTSLSIGRRDL